MGITKTANLKGCYNNLYALTKKVGHTNLHKFAVQATEMFVECMDSSAKDVNTWNIAPHLILLYI